jgi:hypothetical protein
MFEPFSILSASTSRSNTEVRYSIERDRLKNAARISREF